MIFEGEPVFDVKVKYFVFKKYSTYITLHVNKARKLNTSNIWRVLNRTTC